jgi:hypothetical protein
VHSPSDFPTSSPSASVRSSSMRYLTTTNIPRGRSKGSAGAQAMGNSPLHARRGMPHNTPANVQFCSFRELAPGGTLLWASDL